MNTSHLTRRWIAAITAASLCWLAADSASGQAFFRPFPGAQSGNFIEAPRSIQQQLREAERALEQEQYSDAVVRLGDLLSQDDSLNDDFDLAGQDFFLEVDDSAGRDTVVRGSVLRTAREMIGDLPSKAIEIYELRYGPAARKLLGEAAAMRDWQKLREVRRRFFHTLAGYEASLLIAQKEMFAGHALSASLILDDVVTSSRAVGHLGPGVIALYTAAAELAGRDISLSGSAKDELEITIGGTQQTLPAADQRKEWIQKYYAETEKEAAWQLQDYPYFGATPNRNGAESGQLPLSNLRWDLDTTASSSQQRTIRRNADELTTSGKLPPPSWVPLRVGDQLLMRTTERLVGVDYQTGKRVWLYPWQPTSEMFASDEESLDVLQDDSDTNDLLTQRVWNDVPYGQITSDGERVYILDNLREVEIAAFNSLNLRGTRPADKSSNTLVALELATEGKLRWQIGADSEDASSLSDAFFLGPPLPLEGRLYVLAEIAGDINLCCLDPETGEELWRQQIVAVESGGIETDAIRRVAGATPTYHEGVLICPTGAGATVAIDLVDRMLRWGARYERSGEMSRAISRRNRSVELGQLMKRWHSGAAIAAGKSVIITPIESDRLYGFDVLTGEPLFERKSRGYMRYVAGIRDGKFFVVGPNQMKAFDVRTGETVWTTPRDLFAAGQQVAGLGVFGKDSYLLPTTSNQIIRLSLDDGSLIDRRNTNYPLGNLVAVRGEIITQSPTTLAVAFGEATLEPLVNEMLEEDPDNFDALVRKAELLIQHDDRDQALQLLSRAREMQPENDEVQMLSVEAMLGMLRNSEQPDPELVSTLDGLVDRPTQRVELLSLRISAAIETGNTVEAANRLLDLSTLVIGEPLLEASADHVVDDPTRQCSLDGWIAGRVSHLINRSTPEQLSEINGVIRERTAAKAQGSNGLLQRLVAHFGQLEGISPVREQLAERYLESGEFLRLERLALGQQIPSDEGLAGIPGDRLTMLAQAYLAGGFAEDALRVLKIIDDRDDAEADPLVAELREEAGSRIGQMRWPDTVKLRWDSRDPRVRTYIASQRVAETEVLAGRQFRGWRLVSEGSTSPVSLRDPTGLLRRVPMEGVMDDMDKEAKISGGTMVVVMPKGLVGLDLYHVLTNDGEARMWRRPLSGDDEPIAKRQSSMTPFDDQVVRYHIQQSVASTVMPEFRLGPVMGDRILVLQGGDLLAIDLMTSQTIWRNSTAPQSGAVLCDGNKVAVVSAATSKVEFFDLYDGRKLDVRDWEHGAIWSSIGRHVLSYRAVGPTRDRKYEIQLTDPFTGEALMTLPAMGANRSNTQSGVPSGYGRVHNGRYFVYLENDGTFVSWDLMDGKPIGKLEFPAYDDLQGLRVMQVDEQLIVLPQRRRSAIVAQGGQRLQTTDGTFHKTVDGVFAISLDDGSLRWKRELSKPWGCTLTQPAATPMLILARSPYTFATTSRRKSLDVLALDVRNGETLHQRLGKPIESSNNTLETRLTIQGGLNRVVAQIGTELLTYYFGENAITNQSDDQFEPSDTDVELKGNAD